MSLNIYNIKKWYKMISGRSILHVKQDIGKTFSVNKITGYYNDLSQKVIMQPELLETGKLPSVKAENGEPIFFPVAIFQYGLGAYDLYLMTDEKIYRDKFIQSCNWALSKQESSGAWSNFFFVYKDHPYGAMAQGEGASLLIRGYLETHNESYKIAAKKALDFMLIPVEEGGTTKYNDNDIYLLEYTQLSPVLNGWIFSLFGLYDGSLFFDDSLYKTRYSKSILTLSRKIHCFDNGYWSLYDLDKHLASPFYHNLHIAQMQALYCLTNMIEFDYYAKEWQNYQQTKSNKIKAFVVKSFQKILQ